PAVTTSCGFGHRLNTFDTSTVVPLRSSSCLSPDLVIPSLFLPRSRPWLLAKAAEGGLESAPASRLRGAYPHQSNSCAPPQPFGCLLCSWHTVVGKPEKCPHPTDSVEKSPTFESWLAWLRSQVGTSVVLEQQIVTFFSKVFEAVKSLPDDRGAEGQ